MGGGTVWGEGLVSWLSGSTAYHHSVMNSVITGRQSMGHGPVVVHCRYCKLILTLSSSNLYIYSRILLPSDTVGRSGMYCAIHNAVEQCKAEGVVDVFQTVKGVRMHKPGVVSTVVSTEQSTEWLYYMCTELHVCQSVVFLPTLQEQYANTYEVVKAFIDLNNYYQNIITWRSQLV